MVFENKSPGTKFFQSDIIIDTSITAPTVIYGSFDSELTWYPNGYDLKITTASNIQPKYQIIKTKNHISFLVSNKEFNGQKLNISI